MSDEARAVMRALMHVRSVGSQRGSSGNSMYYDLVDLWWGGVGAPANIRMEITPGGWQEVVVVSKPHLQKVSRIRSIGMEDTGLGHIREYLARSFKTVLTH